MNIESRSVGIKLFNDDFVPILTEDEIKTKKVVLTTVKENQKKAVIELFEGDNGKCANNKYIGKLVVNIDRTTEKGMPLIDVFLRQDENNAISVVARYTKSKEKSELTIESPFSNENDVIRIQEDASINDDVGPEDTIEYEDHTEDTLNEFDDEESLKYSDANGITDGIDDDFTDDFSFSTDDNLREINIPDDNKSEDSPIMEDGTLKETVIGEDIDSLDFDKADMDIEDIPIEDVEENITEETDENISFIDDETNIFDETDSNDDDDSSYSNNRNNESFDDDSNNKNYGGNWMRNLFIILAIIIVIIVFAIIGACFLMNKNKDVTEPASPTVIEEPIIVEEPIETTNDVAPIITTTTTTTTIVVVNDDVKGKKDISGKKHFIKRGDNLWNICKRYYGDPWYYPDLAGINDLKSPRRIYVGKYLIIPEKSELTRWNVEKGIKKAKK